MLLCCAKAPDQQTHTILSLVQDGHAKDPRKCRVLRVLDGDTVEIEVHLRRAGGVYLLLHVRIDGINAPEARGATAERGAVFTRILQQWMTHSAPQVSLRRMDKYRGRIVGDFWSAEKKEWASQWMLNNGCPPANFQ
jgi:endonuclease YncB( thermonuclease family)